MYKTNGNKKIFYNGPIVTINDLNPKVEAVGIEGEKIISVGTLKDVKKSMNEGYELVNLEGKTLLPGFIDCHIHAIGSVFLSIYPSFKNIKSLNETLDLLEKIIEDKNPGDFLLGFDLDEERFDNPVFPTKWDLDRVSPDNPVFLFRHDVHIGVGNSKLLELAGIDKETISPEGGEIQKDENGEPTGILKENATSLIFSVYKLPEAKVIKENASEFFYSLAKKGLTSIHGLLELDAKGGVENLGGISFPILNLVKEIVLQNYYGIFFTANPKKILKIQKSPLNEGETDGKFKFGCLKAWFDGSFGAFTAYLSEPYNDQPDNYGLCVIDEDILYNRMKAAHNLGIQIAVHAIGDKANKALVDLYSRLLEEFPRDNHRHRIEHASMLTTDIIHKIKDLGLIASCQPAFIISDGVWLKRRLGKERCKMVYPFRSMLDAGVIIASGSDCPVEDPNPILGIHAMVNREVFIPEEAISVEDALKTFTINGAYAAFEEKVKGSIEVGKLADLVILSENPLEIPRERIKEIQVWETIIRGKTVFKKA